MILKTDREIQIARALWLDGYSACLQTLRDSLAPYHRDAALRKALEFFMAPKEASLGEKLQPILIKAEAGS